MLWFNAGAAGSVVVGEVGEGDMPIVDLVFEGRGLQRLGFAGSQQCGVVGVAGEG